MKLSKVFGAFRLSAGLETNRTGRTMLTFGIICILAGWILDIMSSYIGFEIRKTVPGGYFYLFEASPYFLIFPAAWALMLGCLAFGVYFFPKAPMWLKRITLFWEIILSFAPSIRNTILILEVVSVV